MSVWADVLLKGARILPNEQFTHRQFPIQSDLFAVLGVGGARSVPTKPDMMG